MYIYIHMYIYTSSLSTFFMAYAGSESDGIVLGYLSKKLKLLFTEEGT
jgi:hypothetical protein